MLSRSALRVSRAHPSRAGFATVADTSAVRVAAVDNGQPTSAVTILIKAGSRFETKPGAAHVLKNFAFKNTTQRSSLRTVRESEIYGGVLSATLGREYLALTAEFLRGDEDHFVQVLSNVLTSSQFATYELHESVAPQVEADTHAAAADPAALAVDIAHTLAFRSGLGNPIFASSHTAIDVSDVKEFASKSFTKENIAVIGTGVAESTLTQLVQQYLGSLPSSTSTTNASTSHYHGGETRINAHCTPTLFIGFGLGGGIPSPALSVLASHIDPTPSVKWSTGTSPLSDLPGGASVTLVNETYSDATLIGLVIQAPTPNALKEAGQVAVKIIKDAGAGSIGSDALAKAIAKAKFAAAAASERRGGVVSSLAPQLFGGASSALTETFAALDKIDVATLSKAAKAISDTKPTYVAIGNTALLPYADELGL